MQKTKEKFFLVNLRNTLVNIGKTFSEFTDSSTLIDKSPSRRAWADGSNEKTGVTETMVNKMSMRTTQIFKKWELDKEDIEKASKIEQINK